MGTHAKCDQYSEGPNYCCLHLKGCHPLHLSVVMFLFQNQLIVFLSFALSIQTIATPAQYSSYFSDISESLGRSPWSGTGNSRNRLPRHRCDHGSFDVYASNNCHQACFGIYLLHQ